MTIEAGAVGPMPPFHIYRDFLDAEDHAALIAWALSHEEFFTPSKVDGDAYDADRRSSASLRNSADTIWRDAIVRRVDSLAPTLFAKAGVEPFDTRVKELEMIAYNHGAYFKPHIDVLTGDARHARGDRILSGVYYFHREPKGFSGGALRLYPFGAEGGGRFADVQPEQNSFVLFPSWARHEVREIECPSRRFEDSRFAVNCWLYRARSDVS